jgi:transposase
MKITLLGIDIAKNVFQLHGTDKQGKALLKKQLRRVELLAFIANLPTCTIAMEACATSNYWGRQFEKLGHTVKLISPQYVTPFTKGQKNDRNDAHAIAEAASRPTMRFVPIKNIEQQDIQSIHRIRQRLVAQRTALCNQIRGLLAEYGVFTPQGITHIRSRLLIILDDNNNELTIMTRQLILELYEEFKDTDQRVKKCDTKIKTVFSQNEACKRIAQIEGIGPTIATAIIATVGDTKYFKNGRQFAAFLGLVPKQHSSGGKPLLLGISKRGDRYLRTLLVHGARSVMYVVGEKKDPKSEWLKKLKSRRGLNKTCVALANKNARVIWALLSKGENYRKAA